MTETTMTSPETEFVSILGCAEKSEAPPRISSRSLPENLPVLGLSDIVIFPGAVMPLLVETGPSLKLIDDIVAGDRLLAAVLQRKPEIAEPQPEDLYEVGCVSRLSKMVKFPDGTVRMLVEGLWRIRIKQYAPPAPYLRANYNCCGTRRRIPSSCRPCCATPTSSSRKSPGCPPRSRTR